MKVKRRTIPAKERHRAKLLEYLCNPENEFPQRQDMAQVCGISLQAMYRHFSPEEFTEIEREALAARRKKYSSALARVDRALLKQAESGDLGAIKLAYQRFEQWSDKDVAVDLRDSDGVPVMSISIGSGK